MNGLFGLPIDSSSCLLSWETATVFVFSCFTSLFPNTSDRSSPEKKQKHKKKQDYLRQSLLPAHSAIWDHTGEWNNIISQDQSNENNCYFCLNIATHSLRDLKTQHVPLKVLFSPSFHDTVLHLTSVFLKIKKSTSYSLMSADNKEDNHTNPNNW